MNQDNVSSVSVSETVDIVKVDSTKKIPVAVHVPENVSENIRQQKINRIYDILKTENVH